MSDRWDSSSNSHNKSIRLKVQSLKSHSYIDGQVDLEYISDIDQKGNAGTCDITAFSKQVVEKNILRNKVLAGVR